MSRLACLFTGGLILLGEACSNGPSQSVTGPTTSVVTVVTPPPQADPTPITGIVITPPTDVRAGIPALFTFTVSGLPLISLTLAWGDQTMTDLGAVTQGVISHVYASAGDYTLTVTAKDANGGSTMVRSGPLVVK
jgi:PKD repeat protein